MIDTATLGGIMNDTVAGGLEGLHRLHVRLQDVRDALARGPRQVNIRKRQVASREDELRQLEDQWKQLKMAVDGKSLQLKSNEAKINDLRAKLNAASSNREYDILRSQIDADTMANSVLEDEILEGLEKVDAKQRELGRKKVELETARRERQRLAEEVEAAQVGLQGDLERLEAEVKEAERILPATILDGYRRLVQAHGAAALAAVKEGVCTACNMSLLPQSRVELNSGKTLFCKSCGRLLYLPAGE
ncbi:MAG: hypothetical protein WD066_01105 [Planctomycetaceae bacterium]